MEADYERIIQRLRTAPPTCVSGFKLTPAELPEPWDDNPRSVWQLACPCGSEHARLLGYAISDYTDWPGGENIFISPIGFECAACGEVTEILDTDIHGYNAEVGKLEPDGVGSVKYRGEGLYTLSLFPFLKSIAPPWCLKARRIDPAPQYA